MGMGRDAIIGIGRCVRRPWLHARGRTIARGVARRLLATLLPHGFHFNRGRALARLSEAAKKAGDHDQQP
jgi:hypothetical protein